MSGIISYTAFGGKSGIMGRTPAFAASTTNAPSASGYVVFQTQHFDTANSYDNSTGIYKIPQRGIWAFGMKCNTIGATTWYLRRDGTSIFNWQFDTSNAVNSGWFSNDAGALFELNAGVDIRIHLSYNGTNWDAGFWNFFYGHLVTAP